MSDLQTEAKAAGVLDPDVLRLARPGLTVVEAVADLQTRFPGAFAVRKHVSQMSAAEVAAFERGLSAPVPQGPPPTTKHVDAMTLDELEAFERWAGVLPSLGELARRRAMARRAA